MPRKQRSTFYQLEARSGNRISAKIFEDIQGWFFFLQGKVNNGKYNFRSAAINNLFVFFQLKDGVSILVFLNKHLYQAVKILSK